MPLGRDIGYLPGDVEEKLNPWIQPIFDNVEILSRRVRAKGRAPHRAARERADQVEPLTFYPRSQHSLAVPDRR